MSVFKKILIGVLIFIYGALSKEYIAYAKPNIFDFTQDNSEVILRYGNYRKTKGLLQAYLHDLAVVPKGIIVDDYLTEEDITEIKDKIGSYFMCRPDAPSNEWHGLPRGRDLNIEGINSFLSECRKVNPKAILLCSYHASVYFTGEVVARYKTSGAANLIIDWGKSVNLEYVGPGFDGGELTRGKSSSHTSISIPWYLTDWPAHFIWDYITKQNINVSDYEKSRETRICSLEEMGHIRSITEEQIPRSPTSVDKKLFCDIYEKCVKKVVKYPKAFDQNVPVMILLSLYKNHKIHVFEIWDSKT